MKNILEPFGLAVPNILVPRAVSPSNLTAWAVVACDQYTQDRAYWKKVEEERKGKPSTLSLIFPEVFLEDPGKKERIASIHAAMREYLGGNVFAPAMRGMMYIERVTEYGRKRAGLVTAIDLDGYHWDPAKKAKIRATEATVPARLPPRMEIRRGAPLEIPHVMLLVNDPEGLLVEGTGKIAKTKPPVYDTDLMLGAGHVTGWLAADPEAFLEPALKKIAAANTRDDGLFMFASGDGNHSLASAKGVWDEYRAAHPGEDLTSHPARYALAEIVNIYDRGLTFEPIHRVIFGVDPADLRKTLETQFPGHIHADGNMLSTTLPGLGVVKLQPAVDSYLESHRGTSIDYIHGEEELRRLAAGANTAGFLMPPIDKGSFFETIAAHGTLPRKTFSLGEASEKRFYFECRKLFGAEK
ncbi:MAG: DUF1015 domain-containing protein [Spirochaetaceae bacterium]|jgi:hypothetical protein|nr:DUF1015 domain-containing protein [Spirochaetaceae bacterium]